MHDIRTIRDDPDAFDAALARRGDAPQASALLALDSSRREAIAAAEGAQAAANQAAKLIGRAKAAGDDAAFERLRAEVAAGKARTTDLRAAAEAAEARLTEALMGLPNLPAPDVPDGASEDDNVEMHRRGTPPALDFDPVEHFDIPAVRAGMDFATAAKLSGSRFVVLSGAVARVHRALAQMMLDVHVAEHGLTETLTPVIVNDEAMLGTGQLPKFGDESYIVEPYQKRGTLLREALGYAQPSDMERLASGAPLSVVIEEILERAPRKEEGWLIPTAEVTLTNTVAGEVLDADALPRRLCAHTLCFRSEAGSAGRDTAGMLRQHQFEKVEMVSIVAADASDDEQRRMLGCAEAILDRLGLAYRTVVLCTGDMGFGARRTYDIEVWLPGQGKYREISSVSTCGDFQARRMNARVRGATGEDGKPGKPEFVHTLNGSGLAVGRCLIAVLENGQQADGSVALPQGLHPWLGGATRIGADGTLG
ncbi:MAG: serine--tRNA ligase [Paracoccaceae bacterium]